VKSLAVIVNGDPKGELPDQLRVVKVLGIVIEVQFTFECEEKALGERRTESIRWALLTEMPAAAIATSWRLPASRLDMYSAIC